MRYIVSLSGGTASAVAAERAIVRYGRRNVLLWFADTAWEDEDLYRFMADCMQRWGGASTRSATGARRYKWPRLAASSRTSAARHAQRS